MLLWFTARGCGLAALLALTAATAAGALGSTRFDPGRRLVVQYVHRAAALLGVGLLTVHVLAVIADGKAGVGLAGALVPFASTYRPGAVALGSLAGYAVLALAASGLARGRFAASPAATAAWRGVHALAYLAWGTAMLHGLTAGSDSALPWVRGLFVGCAAAVGAAVAVRLAAFRQPAEAAVR